MIASIRVISDCGFSFFIKSIVFHPFQMSYTTGDEMTVEPYEEVIGNPHYNSSVSSHSPVEEDLSKAETLKIP